MKSALWFLGFDCGTSHKYFLGFVWFDFCASNKRVLLFMVFTVAQVPSAYLVLWFDCGASHKRVLVFGV